MPFFKRKKKPHRYPTRRVYFSLRWKMIVLVCVVMTIAGGSLAYLMFERQKAALWREHNTRAVELVRILRDFSETFLDSEMGSSREEHDQQFDFVQRQIQRFREINSDIHSIMLVDGRGMIRAHTTEKWIRKKIRRPDVDSTLKEMVPNKYNFFEVSIGKKNYLSITYPIFVTRGRMMDIINDFEEYYEPFTAKSEDERKKLFAKLSERYAEFLEGEKENSSGRRNPASTRKKTEKELTPEQRRELEDPDFLFLKLMRETLVRRGKKLPRKHRYLLNEKWLHKAKSRLERHYEDKSLEKIMEVRREITVNFRTLVDHLNEYRRLGALVILFDAARMEADMQQMIREIVRTAVVVLGLGLIVSFLLIHMLVKNIRKLERAAAALGRGNLDVHVDIRTWDELGRLSDVFNHMVRELREKLHLEKFVSASTRSMIRNNGHTHPGDVGRRHLSFFFSDIRGFTSFTESRDPADVIEILNQYFHLQVSIIKKRGGDINDFVGDGIMAHFAGKNHADRAIRTALEIMTRLNRFNIRRKKKNLDTFNLGIGLHSGEVVVGNVGFRDRMDFTAIGDAVNLASRLCSVAEPGEIIISAEMLSRTREEYDTVNTDEISVKGKKRKVKVHRLKIRPPQTGRRERSRS